MPSETIYSIPDDIADQLSTLSAWVEAESKRFKDGDKFTSTEITNLTEALSAYSRLDSQALAWPIDKISRLMECGRRLTKLMGIAIKGMGADPHRLIGGEGIVGNYHRRGLPAWVDFITTHGQAPAAPAERIELTVTQAAARAGINKGSIPKTLDNGKSGTERRIYQDALDAWIVNTRFKKEGVKKQEDIAIDQRVSHPINPSSTREKWLCKGCGQIGTGEGRCKICGKDLWDVAPSRR